MLNYVCARALNHLIIPSNQELKVHVNLQEKRREGEEDRKREEFKAGYGLMPLIPVHSKLKQEDCVVETTSLNYTGKSCLRNLKKEKHTGQGMESRGEKGWKAGGIY